MEDYINKTISNLKPFDYEKHFNSHFINQDWVLVNGISKKKAIYTFKDEKTLEIQSKGERIKTSWNIAVENIFSIKTEEGLAVVKAYFKDDDVLVFKRQDKRDVAVFINTSNYDDPLNSTEDINAFLKEKYKRKVSKTINRHQFYYIEKSKEHGPYTVETLSEKVKKEEISPYCFVKDINEDDYSKRMRINDLIKEL